MLQQLAARGDVEVVRLRLNYRCGSNIVTASTYALGDHRDYAAPEGASQGTIFFHPLDGTRRQQADYLFTMISPQIRARVPDLKPGDVAVLYSTAAIGDMVHEAAVDAGFETLRTDGNAIYPRSNKLLRWLESCAAWCCGGGQTGNPRFYKVLSDGCRYFGEVIATESQRLQFQQKLIAVLWAHRDAVSSLYDWLSAIRTEVLNEFAAGTRTLQDDFDVLTAFTERTSPTGNLDSMTLAVVGTRRQRRQDKPVDTAQRERPGISRGDSYLEWIRARSRAIKPRHKDSLRRAACLCRIYACEIRTAYVLRGRNALTVCSRSTAPFGTTLTLR